MLPQLRMMQKAKVVEKFTAHYVFALGLSRFISCAHWILQVRVCGSGGRGCGGQGAGGRQGVPCSRVCGLTCNSSTHSLPPCHTHAHVLLSPLAQILDGDKYLWQALGSGLWPVMVLGSEVVQTFILADFCFYYVKSYAEGTGVIHLPAGIV